MSCDGCKYFMMCVRRYHKSGRQQKCENFEPDRPHGEWKYNPDCVNDEMQATFFCSICNRGAYSKHDNFCPNCGASMRKRGEVEEGDEK